MQVSSSLSVRAKSPEAFRTISEVASELDVPQHVLRFWESRFSQVRPVKRAGGRRYYRPEDVDLLRGIRTLLYSDGFTIKGVQKVLRDRGLRHVAELGRGDAGAGSSVQIEDNSPIAEEMRFAREALGKFEPAEDPAVDIEYRLAEQERVKLEILLAELLGLKSRLRAARL